VGEGLAYYFFGVALSGALTIAVGRSLVSEHGAKIVPALCIFALLFGVIVGWAIDGYIAYVNLSAGR
jgi:hypothetical protein